MVAAFSSCETAQAGDAFGVGSYGRDAARLVAVVAARLTVLYPGAACRVELSCGKDVLWSGDWGLDVTIDGRPATATSDWSELCWLSDRDVDYLELEIELGEGVRVQRHFVFARKDRFLYLADAVLAPRPSAIGYCGHAAVVCGSRFPAGGVKLARARWPAASAARWSCRWPCRSGWRIAAMAS